jgi:ATP-dependent Clp protease adapter protein ClpS
VLPTATYIYIYILQPLYPADLGCVTHYLTVAVLTVAQGMCGVYPEEHAELYVEQFQRAEPSIYAEMEEE